MSSSKKNIFTFDDTANDSVGMEGDGSTTAGLERHVWAEHTVRTTF